MAVPVGPAWSELTDADRRPPRVRNVSTLPGRIVKARLYASAHGAYEVEINGTRVGDDTVSPGWTVYDRRLRGFTVPSGRKLSQRSQIVVALWVTA